MRIRDRAYRVLCHVVDIKLAHFLILKKKLGENSSLSLTKSSFLMSFGCRFALLKLIGSSL
jgi:hypothetical protein